MLDPQTILGLVQGVGGAAKVLCDSIDRSQGFEHEEALALQNLRQGVETIKSDTIVYKVLITAMKNDTKPNGQSTFAIFINKQDGQEALKSFETALKATHLMLEENPAGIRHEATKSSSGSKKPKRALNFVLNALKVKLRPGQRQEFIDNLKDAINEVHVCQQNTERAFKFVWNLYVITQQYTGRRSSVDNTHSIQDNVGQALDSVLHAFHLHPFALSPEGDSRVNLLTFAALNHNHDSATRYEELARRIGRAWVGDRVQRYNVQVRDLAALQTSLFELLWSGTIEQLKKRDADSGDDPERPEFEKALVELEKALQEAIVRSKKQRFAIAFCGMVKAGKSLFLNALMGRAILPSDELPSTAWPCRLRHVEGQRVPELHFHADPFLVALKNLQAHQYGQRMQTYKPPSENIFDALLSDALPDAPSEPSEEEVKLRTIHGEWIDLHAATRSNLLKFENPRFELPRKATGEQDVKNLLGQLNDIVRLCQRFGLKFDMSEKDWPLLTVEFNSLRGHRMDGIYEFIDLPGIGEGFQDSNFESLVRLVASDSNAIVPVVSFKELPRSDWKRLPDLVTSGFNGRANVVVCTHLDQVSQENIDEQRKTVTKTFWPRDVMNINSVIPCSSLMGLGARDLLDKSYVNSKPPFKEIWKKDAVGYQCAAKILGVGDPKAAYERFDFRTWKNKLEKELAASGLPDAIQTLTREMVDRARVKALLSETDTITKHLKDMRSVHGRKLLEARRTKNDYNSAKRSYDQAREQFQVVLDTWKSQEYMQIQENRQLLNRAFGMISKKADEFITKAIEKTLKDWNLGDIRSGDGNLGRRGSAEKEGNKVLTVKTVGDAEEFLRLSQRELHAALNSLKSEYVTTIRKLAEKAKEKRFKTLRDAIKHLDPRLQPELREEIVNDLESQSINIRKVAFQQIRSMIKTTDTRHTAQTAFRAIEERLARPWLGTVTPPTSDGKSGVVDNDVEVAVQKSINELGFMLRAPIAVLATVPFVFGLPVWPWMVHSRAYHLEMDVIYNRYKDEIITPWIRSLKEEGEKSLIGTIELSSTVAKELVTSALTREDKRYNRELEGKNKPMDQGAVQHLITIYGNLVAAEAALAELFVHIKDKARNGQ